MTKPYQVVAAVEKMFGIQEDEYFIRPRAPRLVLAKEIMCKILREHLRLSYKEIADHTGRMCHTTAIEAVKRANRKMEEQAPILEGMSFKQLYEMSLLAAKEGANDNGAA